MDQSQAEFFEKTLRVTDQGLKIYEKFTRFNHNKLVKNAVVLNLGGGFTQKFEKELSEKRPDVKVLTIDPGIFKTYYYISLLPESLRLHQNKDRKRLESLSNKKNTVVAFGKDLPFSDNSIDEAVDFQGPAQYSRNEEEYKAYLIEVIRVLKQGGKLNICNVFMGDLIPENPESEKSSLDYAKKIFLELGLDTEVYIVEIGKTLNKEGQIVPDKRICATITKK